MHNVSVGDLNVGNLELRLAVDGKNTSVILLTSLLGVEVCLVEEDTERRVGGDLFRRLVEFGRVVDALDSGLDIVESCPSAQGTYS